MLAIVHPESGSTFEIDAEVVWVKAEQPGAGVGLELQGMTPDVLLALERFVRESVPAVDGAEGSPGAGNLYERVRRLAVRDREIMARQGALHERVALERVWGGSVWEPLLQNPQLTAGEIGQIAKNPSLPATLIGTVVANAGWLAKPEIQRALLGNPRLSGAQLDRVLRALPRPELARLAEQSGVRPQVKSAARKLLGG